MAGPAANQTGAPALQFHLFSPLVCPQKVAHSDGLSTGSVLMIILLVAFLTYLTIGIVVNLFVLGARGAEVIPNIQFWRSLPGLVMVRSFSGDYLELHLIGIFIFFCRMAQDSCRMAAK